MEGLRGEEGGQDFRRRQEGDGGGWLPDEILIEGGDCCLIGLDRIGGELRGGGGRLAVRDGPGKPGVKRLGLSFDLNQRYAATGGFAELLNDTLLEGFREVSEVD